MNGVFSLSRRTTLPLEQLLRHCLALGAPAAGRPPARVRLEQALGPELAHRLLKALTAGSRG
jgi:hypothetical protein